MRFPFFSLKRKSKEVATKKMSRMCCFHRPTNSDEKQFHSDPKPANLVHDSPSLSSSDDDILVRHDSTITHVTSTSSGNDCPGTGDSSIHAMQNLLAYYHPNAVSLETEMEDDRSSTPPSEYGHQGNVYTRRFSGEKTPKKGPGMGSADDCPPTRMTLESHKHDFTELSRSFKNRENNGTMAPELPTRLEVCVDRNPYKKAHRPGAIVDSAVSMNREKAIPSHALAAGAFSFTEETGSPHIRSQSPPIKKTPSKHCRHESIGNFSHQRGIGSKCVPSPGLPNRRSSDSTHHEERLHQPTKQRTEEKWDFDKRGIVAPSETQQSPILAAIQTHGASSHVTKDSGPRLLPWHIELKLDWVSECSNDLVAEVCLTDSIVSAPELAATSDLIRMSSSNRIRESQYTKAENNLSEREPDELHLVESAKKQNQTRVVHIVDRILTELQKQKRSSRNKDETTTNTAAIARMQDCQFRHKRKKHGRHSIEKLSQMEVVGTERYREDDESMRRLNRRHEVLKAFEVLITGMEEEINALGKQFTPLLQMTNHIPIVEGSEAMVDFLAERLLAEAVLGDLHDEVKRLESMFTNKVSSPEDKDSLMTMALGNQLPTESEASRRLKSISRDNYEGHELQWHLFSNGHRTQLRPTDSIQPFAKQPISYDFWDMTDYTDQPSSPDSLLGSCLPDQRYGMQERLAKIASVSTERYFADGSDLST